MDKYPDIKFNDLTDSQISEMSKPDIINKALSEYVVEINGHTTDIISCRNHSILMFLTMVMIITAFGWIGLIGLIPFAYFIIGYFKLKKSVVWHIRSFKSTASMYNTLGYDYLIDKHINNIDNLEDIGDLYDFR
jgi:hypothetical protein